jgi:hypothetical protein
MMKPFFRANVPLQSTLTILVSGSGDLDDQAFVASASLRLPDLTTVSWNDQELRAGVTQALDEPGVYDGHVDLIFARRSTARVQMQVLKPDDSKFVYDESVTRSTGPEAASILLVTKDNRGGSECDRDRRRRGSCSSFSQRER